MNSKLLLAIPQPKGMPDWQWLDLRVQLLLIITHHKSAASVHLADTIPDALNSLDLLRGQLMDIGFFVETELKSIHSAYRLYVGCDSESVELLRRALSGTLPKAEADAIHGRLSGFPQTAIDAFLHNETIEPNEIPERMRKSPGYIFGTFRFSRHNWKEELATSAEWAKAIQDIAPDLYQSFLNEFTKMRIG